MHTTSFTVSAKKGDSQLTRWLVSQQIPYPRISAECGQLRWENDEGKLWDRFHNQPATGLGKEYHCYLLADTCPDPVPENYNRTHFAGYTEYNHYSNPSPKRNAGTIKFRGSDLGECLVVLNLGKWEQIEVKIHDAIQRAGKGERAFFDEQIVPKLKAFIAENSQSLLSEAIAKVKARLVEEVAETRRELEQLEKQIATAKF